MARLAALISLIAVLAASSCHPGRHPASHGAAVIPWVSVPAPPAPPEKVPGVPAGSRPCRAADLRVGSFHDGGAAAGTFYTGAEVRNVSRDWCFVLQNISVRFLDRGRQVQVLQEIGLEPGPPLVFAPEPDVVGRAPGAYRVNLRLGISDVCPPLPATTMQIRFPSGDRLNVALPPGSGQKELAPECGSDADRGGYLADFVSTAPPEPEAKPEPDLSLLLAEIVTLGPAHRGERYRYLVRLSNPSTSSADLTPCPAYVEGQKAKGGDGGSFLLNCSTLSRLVPGQTATFEMYIDVPEEIEATPDGRMYLVWNILGGPGAYVDVELSSSGR